MSEVKLTCAGDVKSLPVSWLWPGRVPRGKVTLLAGDPGLGKSFVTMDIAARVSRSGQDHGDWPDCTNPLSEAGDVVVLSAEDDVSDTIRPRLDACGADVDRVHIVDGIDLPERRTMSCVSLDRDIEAVGRVIKRLHNPRLLIIDPISAYMGEADSNNNAQVRAVLAELARMAAVTGIAVLCVTHLSKSSMPGTKAVYRAMGSLAFTAAARMVWYVTRYHNDPVVRAMVPVKNNVGAVVKGMTFRVEGVEGDRQRAWVRWLSTDLAEEADAVEVQIAPDPEGRSESPCVREAMDFLGGVLSGGPESAGRVIARAQEAGISLASLRRAKDVLKLRTKRLGGNEPTRPWIWELCAPFTPRPAPVPPEPAPDPEAPGTNTPADDGATSSAAASSTPIPADSLAAPTSVPPGQPAPRPAPSACLEKAVPRTAEAGTTPTSAPQTTTPSTVPPAKAPSQTWRQTRK